MTTDAFDDSAGGLLRETADRLFQAHCDTATLRSADGGTWPAALWAAIEEAALHRALVPEEAGGFGVAIQDALSLLKVAGAHAAPVPLAETMLASWLLAGAGIGIPDGPMTIAPVRASGADGVFARVPWARNAGHIVIVDGTRTLLIAAGQFSYEAGENIAREPRDTIRLTGDVVATGPAPIAPDQLFAIGAAMRTQQIAGALTRVTEMTTQYAQDRIQFGKPIGKFQAVQQNLAIVAGQTAAALAAADIAADAVANGISIAPIAAGKARAGEAASIAAGIAHQVHAAIGFTMEHNLNFYTRRLWSWRDEFGNDAHWNKWLGRRMAAAGGDRLWEAIVAA